MKKIFSGKKSTSSAAALIIILCVFILTGCSIDSPGPDNSTDDGSLTPTATYKVTYYGGGETGGSAPSDSTEYGEGDVVTVSGNTGSLEKTNHSFSSWNTKSDFSGTDYAFGSSFSMPANDVELYASWQLSPGPLSFTDAEAGFPGIRFNPGCSVADVNDDGYMDIFYSGSADSSPDGTKLYLNDGNGVFSDSGEVFNILWYAKSGFADVDLDGDQDLCYSGKTSSGDSIVYFYINNGAGNFSITGQAFTPAGNGDLAFGDVDCDGDEDLLVCGNSYEDADHNWFYASNLYINEGVTDGTWNGFSESGVSLEGTQNGTCSISDTDGDSYPEILITGRTDHSPYEITILYTNRGDENSDGIWDGEFFDSEQSFPQFGSGYGAAFADIDGDEDSDIILAYYDNDYYTEIWENDGAGSFSKKYEITEPEAAAGKIITGDPDNDGDIDLIVHGSDDNDGDGSGETSTVFFRNNGNGIFARENMGLTGMFGGDGHFFDADGDTDLDLIICGADSPTTGTTILYLNGRLE